MLGIIGGTVFFKKGMFSTLKKSKLRTKEGTAVVFRGKNIVYIPRHGTTKNIPPHMINHRANILALKKSGVNDIIGIGSCGSLKASIRPPAIIIPHDYINFWDIGNLYDNRVIHITPKFSLKLRKMLEQAAKQSGIAIKNRGIYVNTIGPRLETRAEVRILAGYGDIVGMTLAKEATIAQEAGIEYAALASVDNYANGIVKEDLDYLKIIDNSALNTSNIISIIRQLIK